MNFDDYLQILALLRALFYLYITANSLMLAFLYWNAYQQYKMTPIIKAVYFLVLSISLNFFYMVILALVSFIDRNSPVYDWLIVGIPIFTFPLMLAIDNFRRQSTPLAEDDSQKLEKKLQV